MYGEGWQHTPPVHPGAPLRFGLIESDARLEAVFRHTERHRVRIDAQTTRPPGKPRLGNLARRASHLVPVGERDENRGRVALQNLPDERGAILQENPLGRPKRGDPFDRLGFEQDHLAVQLPEGQLAGPGALQKLTDDLCAIFQRHDIHRRRAQFQRPDDGLRLDGQPGGHIDDLGPCTGFRRFQHGGDAAIREPNQARRLTELQVLERVRHPRTEPGDEFVVQNGQADELARVHDQLRAVLGQKPQLLPLLFDSPRDSANAPAKLDQSQRPSRHSRRPDGIFGGRCHGLGPNGNHRAQLGRRRGRGRFCRWGGNDGHGRRAHVLRFQSPLDRQAPPRFRHPFRFTAGVALQAGADLVFPRQQRKFVSQGRRAHDVAVDREVRPRRRQRHSEACPLASQGRELGFGTLLHTGRCTRQVGELAIERRRPRNLAEAQRRKRPQLQSVGRTVGRVGRAREIPRGDVVVPLERLDGTRQPVDRPAPTRYRERNYGRHGPPPPTHARNDLRDLRAHPRAEREHLPSDGSVGRRSYGIRRPGTTMAYPTQSQRIPEYSIG